MLLGCWTIVQQATEVAKLVSESWRSLPPNERAEWDKKAKDDRKRYEDEIKACDDPSMASCSKKDPDAPKRPMSAFLAYSNKKRASLKRKNPYLNNGEMSKFLSKTWKEESEEERQKYIDEARELRLKHKIAVKERNKEVRKQEKEKLKRQIKEQKQEAKRGEQTKTRSEEDNGDPQSSRSSRGSGKIKGNPNRKATTPGAPKRPISAFLEYSNGKRASVKRKNPSLSNADISKHLSEQWKAEEPNIRQGFLDAAHDRRVKHKSDMADWHKSMEQRMQDQYQQNRRTESSEYKNSDDITSEDAPTTSETEGIPDTSTGASSSGYASFPTAPSTASVTVATGNHAMFSNHQGTGGPINTANLQYSFPNLSGTNTLGSMQPGGIPALHQPINPFAVAPPSDMPSVAYIPVLTTPGNTILPGYLPGSLPGSIAASTGAPYNSNSASAAAVSYLPTVQGPATQFLPFDSSVGLNAVAAAAGSLNTDRSLFTQQNAAAMVSAQSLAQPATQLLNSSVLASNPSQQVCSFETFICTFNITFFFGMELRSTT